MAIRDMNDVMGYVLESCKIDKKRCTRKSQIVFFTSGKNTVSNVNYLGPSPKEVSLLANTISVLW